MQKQPIDPNKLLAVRGRAREVLKDNRQNTLVVFFIVMLPSLIQQVISVRTGYSLSKLIASVMESLNMTSVSRAELVDSILTPLLKVLPVLALTMLVSWLLTQPLLLGRQMYVQSLLRGDEPDIGRVARGFRYTVKSLGLAVGTYLRVLVWTLPGIAVFIASTAGIVLLYENTALYMVLGALQMAAYGAMFYLGLRAILSYCMAMDYLAADPERKLGETFRLSRGMMEGRRAALVSVLLPMILGNFAVIMLSGVFCEVLGEVLGTVLSLFLQLLISVYMSVNVTSFWMMFRETTAPAQTEERPE